MGLRMVIDYYSHQIQIILLTSCGEIEKLFKMGTGIIFTQDNWRGINKVGKLASL